MADWYVSSTAYAAIPVFAANHAYSVGDIIRPTSPSANQQYPFRCTTAGTSGASEPTWSGGNNSTTTSGTAVFTNIGGQSAYAWSAACGSLASLTYYASKNIAVGDRVFVSHDHVETNAATNYWMVTTTSFTPNKIISVNKAGSVPLVAADIQAGVSISVNAGTILDANSPMHWDGVIFTMTGAGTFMFNNSGYQLHYFKNSAFVFTTASASARFSTGSPAKVVFDNTTVKFGGTDQQIKPGNYPLDLTWLNTPSAVVGPTYPTTLFANTSMPPLLLTCRGVDFGAFTGTIVNANASSGGVKALFDSCKINAGAVRYGTPSNSTVINDEVEYVNCFDGINIINERYVATGRVTTDTSTYLTGGAADDVGSFSHKMVSNANAGIMPSASLDSFWLDVENAAVGSPKTATVEIVSSASLNNTDIHLLLEYQGTSGSSVASFADSLADSTLPTSVAVTASSATWNNPPSTPVYQKLQVTFTPQTAGRVRGQVRLGKASTTVWVNPQITIT